MNKKIFLIALALGMVSPVWAQGGAVVPLAETALKPVGNGMVDALGRTVINGVTFPVLETVPTLANATFSDLLVNPPTMTQHTAVIPVEVKKEVFLPSAPKFIQSTTALPQTRTVTEVHEVTTRNLEVNDELPGRIAAMKRVISSRLEHFRLLEVLKQMERMIKRMEYQRSDYTFAEAPFIKKEYPNRWDLMRKRPDAVAASKAYWEDVAMYRVTMNNIQSFFEEAKSIMERKSLGQNIDQKTIDALWEKENLLKKRIQILDETMGARPWEVIRKVQYLQQIEYYLKRFVEEKHPIQLPEPILKPNPATTGSFYSWHLSSTDEKNAPKNLRVAVIHDDKDIYEEIKRDVTEAGWKWEIDSFTPKEFLKKDDFFLYDVVIGDFLPPKHEYAIIRDPYSRVLSELTFRGNGGILILSVSKKDPDSDCDSKTFAQLNIKAGIDGTLRMWEESVAYRRYLNARIANFYLNKWRKK